MEEHVFQLRSYLPVIFEDAETDDFIEYLVSAYLENLIASKYQFSFTAFHMLYMSYIYKVKWFLKMHGDISIDDSIQEFIRQNRGATFNTLFDLSQFSEKSSLEKLLKTLRFHANDVDLCKNLVEVRNKCSHASGKIYFKRPQQVENYILEEIDSVQAIQKKIKPFVKTNFEKFIDENWNRSWLQSEITQWIAVNYLSQKEIEELLQLKPAFTKQNSDGREIFFKKLLYASMFFEFSQFVDEKGSPFLKSLEILMLGLPAQIDLRKDDTEDPKIKNTQELIEERILPLLTQLSNDISIKAQNILLLSSTN